MAGRKAHASRVVREALPRAESAEPILLDSHVWLWYVAADERPLTSATVALIDAARARGEAYISHVTPWEITAKATLGRLQLTSPPRMWIAKALAAGGFPELPLSLEILLDAACMTAAAPRDPMDRLLIATARRHGCALLTADRSILDWGRRSREVRVIRVR